MAQTDGDIIIGTKLDDSEFSNGLNKLGSIATKAMASVTAAIGAAAIAAIKVGADFEEGMSKVAAISGVTGEDLDKLKEKAMEMGAKTKFSATEASEALQYMAMAGWKTEDMLGGLDGIMNLAAASGEDLASTSDIVTDALTAFGLSAQDSTRFADVLAAASSNANTNVGMMGETFKYVAPVAGALGYTVEDTAVAIGLMANSGIKGSQAGTALRSMLSRLSKPTDDVEAAMQKLGISLTNSDGKMKSFNEVALDLRKSFSTLSQSQKTQMAATLAGQEAMSGLLAIVNASDADFNKLKDSIDNSSGSAEKMANTMNDNLKGKLTIIGSTLEGIGIKAYDKFKKPLSDALESAQESLNGLDKSMGSGKLEKSVDKIAKAFGDLVKVTANLASKAIPAVINGFSMIIDNAEVMAIALTAVGAIMASYKTYTNVIMPMKKAWDAATLALVAHEEAQRLTLVASYGTAGGMTVLQTVVGVLTGKISLATAATGALNSVMNINPAVLVTTSIIALGAAMAALTVYVSNHRTEAEQLNESLHEEADAIRETAKAANEQAEENVKQTDLLRSYKEELDNIVDANGKVTRGYEDRASFLVGELAEATGLDIKLVNGQIQGYNKLSKSIDNTIEKMRAEAILEAHKEEYDKAVSKKEDALKKLVSAQDEYNKALKNRNSWEESYLKTSYDSSKSEQENRAAATKAWKESVATLKDNLDTAKSNVKKYTETIVSYENGKTSILKGNYDDLNDIIDTNSSKYADTIKERKKSLEDEIKAEQANIESYGNLDDEETKSQKKKSRERIENKRLELFSLQNEIWSSSDSYKEAYKFLSEQGAKAFDENGNLTDEVKKKIDDAHLKAIESSGEYTSVLQDMANDGKTVFEQNGDLTTEAQKKLTDSFISMNSLAPGYSQVLTNMAEEGKAVFDQNGSLTSAVQKKLIDVFAKENSLSPQYATELKNMASKGQTVFNANGNLTKAAKKKLDDAIKAAGDKKTTFGTTLKEISEKGKEKMEEPDYESTGKHLIDGAKKGVENNEGGFLSKIGSLAEKALSSLSKIWDINSPSKEAEYLTEMLMRGLEKGVVTNEDLLLDPIENVASNATDTISNIFDTIGSSKISAMIAQMQSEAIAGQMRVVDSAKIKVEYDIDKASLDNQLKNKLLLNATNNNEQIIDYNRLAQVLVQALQGVEFEFDERGFIRLVRKVI